MKIQLSVLIADDHPTFRKGLRQVIETDATFRVVDEAGDGEEALALIKQHAPDIVVLDIDMPTKNGLEVAREISREQIPVDIVFLTMYDTEDMFNEAMDIGAVAYVLKDSAVTDILQSIKAIAAGKYYISPGLSQHVLGRSERAAALLRRVPSLNDLTPAERRVLKLISENQTSKEIAVALHISYKTVENHRTNISNKLNIRGSHTLLKFALENKSALRDQ